MLGGNCISTVKKSQGNFFSVTQTEKHSILMNIFCQLVFYMALKQFLLWAITDHDV